MQTVQDDDGNRYLRIKRSADSSLVRDPATGETRYVDNDRLSTLDGQSPLVAAVEGIPDPVRTALTATRDDRSLGLLVELVDRESVAVRTLLADYDLCESDLHGLLAEFQAAGLAREVDAPGGRGYEPTADAVTAVRVLRDDDPE